MYHKSFRGNDKKSGGFGSRGGSSFGDKRGGKNFGGGRDWKPMHDATCAGCGANCQVPFKPNGRKPVYCSNCFGKEDRGGKSYDRPSFDRSGRSQDSDVSTQLKMINDKLDAIIQAMEE